MANQKVSARTALTAANVATDDLWNVVDTSATESKSMTTAEARTAMNVPSTLADADAPTGGLYYSSGYAGLAYKNSSGLVEPLNLTATVYVGPAGNDANAGTRALPFLTIRAALTAVGGGGKVIVLDGDYAHLALTSADVGTAAAPTTIMAENKHQAKLTGDATYHAVNMATGGTNYITLDGFEITSSAGTTDGVKVEGTNCIVQNCWIHDTGGQGILSTVEATSSIYRYNHVEDCGTDTGDHGIYNIASSVRIHDNSVHGSSGYGIHCFGSPGQSNCDIHRNHCYSNTTSPMYLVGPEAGGACGHTVRDNLLDQSYGTAGGACLTISDCESASITGNILIAFDGPIVYEVGGCTGTVFTGNILYTQLADINTHGAYDVSDLVTNGDFEDVTVNDFANWAETVGGSMAITDGGAGEADGGSACVKVVMDGSNYAQLLQSALMTVGDMYTLTFRGRRTAAATASFGTSSVATQISSALSTDWETHRITFVASSVDLKLIRGSASGATFYIDNVSLVQAYGPSPGDIARCTPHI